MKKIERTVCSIAKLSKAAYNPRTISKEARAGLQKSIERFGLVQEIVVNRRGMRIISGHQRFDILKEQGEKDVPIVLVDLPPAEEKALNVTMNSVHLTGDFTDGLQDILDELQKAMPEDFANLRLDELIGDLTNTGNTDPDDAPPLPKKAVSKLGDLYQLGAHRLLCGDSLDMAQVKRLIDTNTVDMVYNDPPYGMKVVKKNCQNNSLESGHVGIKGLAKPGIYNPVIGDNSTKTARDSVRVCLELKVPLQIFWGANFYADALPPSSGWIVWDKENGDGFFADGELAWTNTNRQLRIFRHQWKGMIRASERGQRRVHPTQKPVALAEFCITEFGKDTKVVMDLFGGSGSTLIACEQTKRRCLMMERSEAYADVIINRWQTFTGSKAKKYGRMP